MKHTKGPWVAVPYAHGTTVKSETADISIAWCGTGFAVSALGSHSISAAEAEANGRLMAAAPDLLKATQWLLSCVEGSDDNDEGAMDFAKEALAKAIRGVLCE